MANPAKEYALYKGDKLLAIGTKKEIAKQLSKVQKDDLIYLKGHLVEVRAQDGWIWRSSLTREDTGNGACELFLIEDINFFPYLKFVLMF